MVNHLPAKHRRCFLLCDPPGRSEAVRSSSGHSSALKALISFYFIPAGRRHDRRSVPPPRSLLSACRNSGETSFARITRCAFQTQTHASWIMVGVGVGGWESAFNKVPRGVVRKAPDKSLAAWGQSPDICPLSCTKDYEARHCCCLGQSSKHSCGSEEDMMKI